MDGRAKAEIHRMLNSALEHMHRRDAAGGHEPPGSPGRHPPAAMIRGRATSGPRAVLSNRQIAPFLVEAALLLEAQKANPFRVRAYRNAAAVVERLDRPVGDILHREGRRGLESIAGIGRSLARSIEQIALSGHFGLLDSLRGHADPEHLIAAVPGLGPELAHRIHTDLGVETLPELEAAAYDGRLARLRGIGVGRLRAVRSALHDFLHPRHGIRTPASGGLMHFEPEPPVSEILDVDREYREAAATHRLPRIAPRRLNPGHEAWLPILHTERGDRHYTALYSNTERAHRLGKTRDWVVIYRDDEDGHGQWTVVTEHRGRLAGRRVVRGRESSCVADPAVASSCTGST